MKTESKMVVGCLESCALPDLGISDLKVRIDRCAKTSSLHVDNISSCKIAGKAAVQFCLHPEIHNVEKAVRCQAPLKDIRRIKSSNGEVQSRYVVETTLSLGGQRWPIEVTLSDRSDMSYLMLLGREGMKGLLVDPSESFLLSDETE